MRIAGISLLLAAWPLGGWAGTADAWQQVATAKYFAFGGIGFAGITTESEIGFRAILASGTAASDFRRLLKSGNPQGRCYALVGLRLTDRPAFEEEIDAFLKVQTPVETASSLTVTPVRARIHSMPTMMNAR